MADTAHTPTAQDSPASRQIRVFLSSTFRDFMEERDLLVKQVFPVLRRRAQEHGVEVVDVDLRWGVTQEESEQGKVIGICLAEIERCRPYFIGMLGERYGWTPGKTDYPDELFEREHLGWIRDHQGDASVTELEILHGVLNDKEMAGRAFFYFRDPRWSRYPDAPGYVCDTPEEEAKLAALKDRIRASGFPVAEDLPDPKAIADQIEADLWALIEEQYPDLDQADALEREARKHANYRQSRLGVYLGQEYVDQLEALVHGGEQKILITGESGSGKSALIANWIHQHELEHPGDVVYAHHLGCSNDANAIRPLLGRMLDTASKLLKEAELITEPIQVPQGWWELTAKVAETLQDLGRWCRKTGKRWIWVLDGLDRLADDDQQALPWLPLLIPEGVSVLISALDCPARAIIEERQFQLLEIGPLRRNEQEQLIDSYLGRYTKKLDADRVEQILASPLARSPLFLRVLLEELRQCGRFETLEAQIADYIRPKADGNLAVNDLYARVLARLERDYGYEPVRKSLTALWASRAGLSEPELQSITGLAPLQWAPIDLALEEALGRNGSRLVFGHDYLCKAVEDRYLLSEEQRLQIHNELADWFDCKEEWDERKAEELPWQLLNASRDKEVISYLKDPEILLVIANSLGNEQACRLFILARKEQDISLCSLISRTLTANAEKQDLLSVVDKLSGLFEVLEETSHVSFIELQSLALNSKISDGVPPRLYIDGLFRLSLAYQQAGRYEEAISSLRQCSEEAQAHMGGDITLKTRLLLHEGNLFVDTGNYLQAESLLKDALLLSSESLCEYDPNIGTIQNSLGYLYRGLARYEEAAILLRDDYERSRNILGSRHQQTIISLRGLAQLHLDMEEHGIAKDLFTKCLEATAESFGLLHPSRITDLSRLAEIASALGEQKEAENMFKEAARVIEILSTSRISELDIALTNSAYAGFLEQVGRLEEAINLYRGVFEVFERICGQYHHDTIVSLSRYSDCLLASGCFAEAEPHLLRLLSWHSENGDIYWANRNRYDLSRVLYQTRQTDQAISVLDQLLVSMSTLDELDDSDRQLIDNATNLMTELKATET